MNKFTKVILILACSLFGIGLTASLIAVFVIGVSFNDVEQFTTTHIVSFHVGSSGSDSVTESFEGVKSITLETDAADILISAAEVEQVEVVQDGAGKNGKIYMDGNKLSIACDYEKDQTMVILVPEDIKLDELELELGAGRVQIDDVAFDVLEAEVGAGELVVNVRGTIDDYRYDIGCGLGEVQIGDETYSGTNLSKSHEKSTKYISIDCGVGRVEIQERKIV